MAKNKFRSGLIIFIIILALGLFYTIFYFAKIFGKGSGSGETIRTEISINTNGIKYSGKGEYISAIYLTGTIQAANNTYNQDWILNQIEHAKNDSRNRGIALFINSPGGTVYHSDEVYLALQNYKTTGKKVYAYFGPTAASGAYYIGCAADQIYANRNTITGSIGIISSQFVDMTELMEKVGIKSTTIHSGRNKTMGSTSEPVTEEQLQIMQTISDEYYDQFVSIVCGQRHIPIDEVYELADGRVYTAYQALDNGLIDVIDSWENMIKDMAVYEFDNPDINVVNCKYAKKQTLVNMMMNYSQDLYKSQMAAKLGLPKNIIEEMESSDLYPAYLYTK